MEKDHQLVQRLETIEKIKAEIKDMNIVQLLSVLGFAEGTNAAFHKK